MAQIIIEDLSLEEREIWLKQRARRNFHQSLLGQYKENEVFRYKLTVEGNSHVQTMKSDFKIISIYKLIYKGLVEEDKLYRFSLTEESYKLEKYEDPIVAQIIEMSNLVSGIYQHLDFGVNGYGDMKKIYNREEINRKWEKTKEHLTYKHPLSSYEIIKTKEKELSDPVIEIANISFMHFLQVYFKQFGRYEDKESFIAVHMDQFGSGIPFELAITFAMQPSKNGLMHRKMSGEMLHDKNVINALCKVVKDDSAYVDYKTQADYYSDGVIIEEVNFSYEQKIGEGYNMYSYLHLELIKDGE